MVGAKRLRLSTANFKNTLVTTPPLWGRACTIKFAEC
jgi:hypothetical protein